jgi:hypothetical protein
LLACRPLYALADWLARRVPEYLGLEPEQLSLFQDDRIGRVLDRLHHADRASMLTALVVRAVREFRIKPGQVHNDTATVTFCCYAKAINLSPETEPDIFQALRFGAVLENVVLDEDHSVDFTDTSTTENTRGAYPIHFIRTAWIPPRALPPVWERRSARFPREPRRIGSASPRLGKAHRCSRFAGPEVGHVS